MALAPTRRDGQRLLERFARRGAHLFTFFNHPEVSADTSANARAFQPTAALRPSCG
jgi:hypothetical protein